MGGWITFGNGGHSVSRHRNLARFQSHIFLCSILVALTATTNADPFSKTDVTLKSNVDRGLVAGHRYWFLGSIPRLGSSLVIL